MLLAIGGAVAGFAAIASLVLLAYLLRTPTPPQRSSRQGGRFERVAPYVPEEEQDDERRARRPRRALKGKGPPPLRALKGPPPERQLAIPFKATRIWPPRDRHEARATRV